jgi:alpha-glucosidase
MVKKETLRFFTELGGKPLVDDIRTSEKLIERYNRRYASKRQDKLLWKSPGAVQQVIPYERGVRLSCQNGWAELHWIAQDCLRVRLRTGDGNFIEPFSYAVNKVDWQVVQPQVIEGSDALEMRTTELVCRVDKRALRIGLEGVDGSLYCVDRAGMAFREDGNVRLSMALQAGESSYGMAERAAGLQLRGRKFTLWNTDPDMYSRGTDPLHYSIPFYLGVHGQGVYGVFWDNSSRGIADLGAGRPDELLFEAEAGELRYYLFTGADVKSVVARYTELTGRIPLPPLWSLGYQQARFSYSPQDSVLKVAEGFRAHSIPCDVLYLDIHHMDDFRVFTWDAGRFPNPRAMLNQLHDYGFHVVAVIDPGVKVDPKYAAYSSGIEQGVFVKYPDGERVTGAVWGGLSHFPDFTNPAARSWWAGQVASFVSVGVDGLLNDMTEPAVFTLDAPSTLPDAVRHHQDGLGSSHVESHNIYGMLMARASREGLQKSRPEARPFNLVRSGFAGSQRYASSWTGDNSADWDHLRLSVSMALNMGLSGAPMTGPDIGGFNKEANPELFTRWLQAASLMPFFRANSKIATQPQEPWVYGQPYEVINRLTIDLRYKLLPYLYSVVAQAREYGWPVIRPIFTAEPDNPSIRSIDDCYLLGDALLVAPVLEPGAVRKSVYLPAGEWYDYWSNELLEGGETITVPAPLERLPLFVRAGAVLPVWPEMQYVGEKPVETLTYRVYPGNFETVLYEDRGEGLEHLQGDYRWIYLTCAWEDSLLVVNRRVAGRYEAPYKQIKLEILGFDEEPQRVRIDRQGAPLWFYDDGLLELTIDHFQRVEVLRKPLPTDRTIVRRPWDT